MSPREIELRQARIEGLDNDKRRIGYNESSKLELAEPTFAG